MTGADLLERGFYLRATRHADVTAWFEEAARRHGVKRWHGAIYGSKWSITVGGHRGCRSQQSACVWMGGRAENVVAGAKLNHCSGIHDGDTVCDAGDDGKIV